ncbi:MAG TPA: transcriptional repressor [Alphaproteobacteria bacterium]|nr:transcriptional repressor [Alphaproteobacteria bacterium]
MTDIIREKFEKAQIRVTPQRALIVETIMESSDHPDADLIYRRAIQKDSSVSVATTYRTLNLLEEAGILRKLNMQDGKVRYEIEREDHNHLVDVENERIHEFKDERLGALMREIVGNMGYDVESFRVEVVGKKRGNTECGCIQIKVY